jgi:hypothetical protein
MAENPQQPEQDAARDPASPQKPIPPAPDPLRPLHPPLPHSTSRQPREHMNEPERQSQEQARRRLDEEPPELTGAWRPMGHAVGWMVRLVTLVMLLAILVAVIAFLFRLA